jgi:hypothetical protein
MIPDVSTRVSAYRAQLKKKYEEDTRHPELPDVSRR